MRRGIGEPETLVSLNRIEDFQVEGYMPHGPIKADVAV